jgi:hypothetical protein
MVRGVEGASDRVAAVLGVLRKRHTLALLLPQLLPLAHPKPRLRNSRAWGDRIIESMQLPPSSKLSLVATLTDPPFYLLCRVGEPDCDEVTTIGLRQGWDDAEGLGALLRRQVAAGVARMEQEALRAQADAEAAAVEEEHAAAGAGHVAGGHHGAANGGPVAKRRAPSNWDISNQSASKTPARKRPGGGPKKTPKRKPRRPAPRRPSPSRSRKPSRSPSRRPRPKRVRRPVEMDDAEVVVVEDALGTDLLLEEEAEPGAAEGAADGAADGAANGGDAEAEAEAEAARNAAKAAELAAELAGEEGDAEAGAEAEEEGGAVEEEAEAAEAGRRLLSAEHPDAAVEAAPEEAASEGDAGAEAAPEVEAVAEAAAEGEAVAEAAAEGGAVGKAPAAEAEAEEEEEEEGEYDPFVPRPLFIDVGCGHAAFYPLAAVSMGADAICIEPLGTVYARVSADLNDFPVYLPDDAAELPPASMPSTAPPPLQIQTGPVKVRSRTPSPSRHMHRAKAPPAAPAAHADRATAEHPVEHPAEHPVAGRMLLGEEAVPEEEAAPDVAETPAVAEAPVGDAAAEGAVAEGDAVAEDAVAAEDGAAAKDAVAAGNAGALNAAAAEVVKALKGALTGGDQTVMEDVPPEHAGVVAKAVQPSPKSKTTPSATPFAHFGGEDGSLPVPGNLIIMRHAVMEVDKPHGVPMVVPRFQFGTGTLLDIKKIKRKYTRCTGISVDINYQFVVLSALPSFAFLLSAGLTDLYVVDTDLVRVAARSLDSALRKLVLEAQRMYAQSLLLDPRILLSNLSLASHLCVFFLFFGHRRARGVDEN